MLSRPNSDIFVECWTVQHCHVNSQRSLVKLAKFVAVGWFDIGPCMVRHHLVTPVICKVEVVHLLPS